jgi:putative ABC transport system substrate-binding protein
MQEIGILDSASPEIRGDEFSAFFSGLVAQKVKEPVIVSYVWANNDYERLPELARDLVERKVKVIVAAGGTVSAIAAKQATESIPIVFTAVTDPTGSGLVSDLGPRQSGNMTGIAGITSAHDPKRLEYLQRLKPKAGAFGVLMNPCRPAAEERLRELKKKAKKLCVELQVGSAGTEQEITQAFNQFARAKVDALLVAADPLFNSHREQIVALAAAKRIAAIYQWPDFVEAGGLMSYGPKITDAYRQAGEYTGQILNGNDPFRIKIAAPGSPKRVINLMTAKKLRLRIPADLRKGAVLIGQ